MKKKRKPSRNTCNAAGKTLSNSRSGQKAKTLAGYVLPSCSGSNKRKGRR